MIYIGRRVIQNTNKDNTYLGSGIAFNNAFKLYGEKNFKREILEYCSDNDSLNACEIRWVKIFKANQLEIGYNLTEGGNAGDKISKHPNKVEIIKRRVETWKANFHASEERRLRNKEQLKEAKKNRDFTKISKKRKRVVEIDINTNLIVNIYDSITLLEEELNITGVSTSIRLNNLCHNKYYRFFREDGIYDKWVKKDVWNKGLKGLVKRNKTTFKKNQIPWNKDKGGYTSKSKSKWTKDRVPWNKNMTPVEIESIEYIEDIPDYVYNIEVRDNHNYYVNGILTHNCDDPQNPKMAASEVERKNVKNFYDTTLYSRLNQPELGVRIVVMQRLAEEDLSGHLIITSPEKHKHICIPVEVDLTKLEKENISPKELIKYYDKDGLYWPSRFSKSIIEDYIKRLGSKEAAGQLYQRPAPKEGNMVKEAWFDILDPTTLIRDLRYEPMMFYVDTAESEEQQENGDSTAIVTAYKKDNIVYICNIVKVKKAFYELTKYIPEHVKDNLYSQFSMIKVEPKSSGKSIVSQLRAVTQLNIVELPAPKDSKVVRLSSVTPMLESRRVKFLQGNYLQPFMNNLLVFPNGKHDDDVDAFIHCVEDLLTGSDFDFAFTS